MEGKHEAQWSKWCELMNFCPWLYYEIKKNMMHFVNVCTVVMGEGKAEHWCWRVKVDWKEEKS